MRVLNSNGLTPEGIPYFDFTDGLSTGLLNTGDSTSFRTIVFSNPNKIPFTFEIVVLGRLNQPPEFTSVPVVEALVGNPTRTKPPPPTPIPMR